jgi:CPA2 family monovalent cation:H+ antiporter-2
MLDQPLVQILLLLVTAVAAVFSFKRLNIPTSLGYLLAGLLLGPYTVGPVLQGNQIGALAEFGVVFLLFTVGLNFSLPQLQAMRNTVLGLGVAQVALTTTLVGLGAWLFAGLPAAAAFVVGAVFAQSSTTIISNQLLAQGEDNSRHGRMGVGISVFQDVTAVPLLILLPVFGAAVGIVAAMGDIAVAVLKAVFAFLAVLLSGRWLLRPLFHYVATQRSAELFTLTVLLTSLAAGWFTSLLGLSMAFGAFLAGMMLGETEFRHQVEGTIRPFRDVLLGLFFISIGMLIDPAILPAIWQGVVLGTAILLGAKILLVSLIVRWSGLDLRTALRTGLLLAVGGEFGFALLAIAINDGAIDAERGQLVLYSVLLSMVVAPFLIRYNDVIASRLTPAKPRDPQLPGAGDAAPEARRDHVVICGYGRIGQSVGNFLEEERIPFIALDMDATRVREAHLAGEPVFFGDSTERDVLQAVGVEAARLVVISLDDTSAARKVLGHVRAMRADIPVMVRTRDGTHVDALRLAGATEVVPETLEAGLMIASQTLLLLEVPLARVLRLMQRQRTSRYPLLREIFPGDPVNTGHPSGDLPAQLHSVPVDATLAGRQLGQLPLDGVAVNALVRRGERIVQPPADLVIETDDVLVLFGNREQLQQAEVRIAREQPAAGTAQEQAPS